MFPTDLEHFFGLVRQYGEVAYSFMFGYAMLHTLLLAIFAGYAAQAGALQFWPLLAVCWIGTYMGDVVRFWIGRRFGTRWLRRWPRLEHGVKTAARLADRHHVWMMMMHRFPYGVRGIAGFAYGASSLSWPRFLAWNVVAAGLWAAATVGSGYAFGFVAEKTLSDAASGLGIAMLVVFLALAWVLSRRLGRVMEQG